MSNPRGSGLNRPTAISCADRYLGQCENLTGSRSGGDGREGGDLGGAGIADLPGGPIGLSVRIRGLPAVNISVPVNTQLVISSS